MEKEMLIDMRWKSMEHLVNMKWFDIPILRTMGKDNLCLYFVSIEQIVAVMPKLIVVASLAIQLLLLLFLSQLGELIATDIVASQEITRIG